MRRAMVWLSSFGETAGGAGGDEGFEEEGEQRGNDEPAPKFLPVFDFDSLRLRLARGGLFRRSFSVRREWNAERGEALDRQWLRAAFLGSEIHDETLSTGFDRVDAG